MKNLPKTQQNSLEILILFDKICEHYNLKYTLIYDTLLGAVKCNGFLPDSYNAKVAMLYNDYLKFLDVCKTELQDTPYYIINYEIDNRFEVLYSNLVKRSRVVLPPDRKKDEVFYDFTIDIIPIFDCSNKKKEFNKNLKRYQILYKILEARKHPKNYKKRKWLRYYLCTVPLLKKNRSIALKKLQEFKKGSDNCTKYVLLGSHDKNFGGCTVLAETYKELVQIEFEGYKFWAIKDYEQWLLDTYKNYYDIDVSKIESNIFLLKGPEELRRVQLVQLEMLKEIDRICRKHNINYFLCSGTLLGAIRHGGFIPWDYDSDVAMLKKDYDKFLNVVYEELDSDKYVARNKVTEPTIHITYTQIRRLGTSFIRRGREHNKRANHGILVDVFPVYNGGNNFIKHSIQTKLCMFFKTMFWTHNGANSEKIFLKRKYYNFLARFSPDISYRAYMKYANIYENTDTNKVAWLVAKNNPYYSEFTNKRNYIDYIDIEFEGYKFKTIKNWNIYLQSVYSEQYNLFPSREKRFNGFIASGFDAGDLYPYEEEDSTDIGAKMD